MAWELRARRREDLSAEYHVTGDTVRAVVLEGPVRMRVIDALRREGMRIISVAPVRTSLEEYYVRKLKPSSAAAGAMP